MNQLPEKLADELLRTHEQWLLTETAKALVQRLVGEVCSEIPNLEKSNKSAFERNCESAKTFKTAIETRKRRPGRPRGTRRPWSPERIARHRAKQERGAQMLNSPEVQALTDAIWKASGKERPKTSDGVHSSSQDDGSEKPKANSKRRVLIVA
jgi:hypothetical protein